MRLLHRQDLAELAIESGNDPRPWQDDVEELGVCPTAVEREGAFVAGLFASGDVPYLDAVSGAFTSGFHLGLLAGRFIERRETT